MISKIKKYIVNKSYRFDVNSRRGVYNHLCDEAYLKRKFYLRMGKELNLENPKTFNEKLQWLKIHDRKSHYTNMVDKYEAKEYVADLIGKEYIIPTLGVWDRFEDIDFDSLPNQFVLKCTHDSGGLAICKDKSTFNFAEAKKKIKNSLKLNYYWGGREWPYKNVKPRIIAEKYMEDSETHELIDYKLYCFNGQPYKTLLCIDRYKDTPTRFYSFDTEWNLLRHNKWGKEAPENFTLPAPDNIDDMYKFARIFSDNIPFLRVDFYEVNGRLYFGELTFYPDSGFDSAILPEIDQLYGEMININL